MRKRGRTIPAGVTDGGCERSRGHALDWGKHRVEKGEGRSSFPQRAPQPKCTRFKVDDIRKWVKSVGTGVSA